MRISCLSLLLCLTLLPHLDSALAADGKRPNFVILIADDIGCDDLGCDFGFSGSYAGVAGPHVSRNDFESAVLILYVDQYCWW